MAEHKILITGGSGSFGSRCARYLLDRDLASRIVIYSRGELRQWRMRRELDKHKRFDRLRFFIGDVRDPDRLKLAMRDVDYVIHAAAMKHIDACEYNPTEAVRTNVNGGENVVLAALSVGVKRCITVSTDKAVSPVNLYGSTKLAAEKIMIAANNLAGSQDTRFAVVRYGNVIGSSGSVIPLFLDKIEKGEPLPITDRAMTRFLMRIGHGIALVCDALTGTRGGEIIVPKAPSARIVDLAAALVPPGRSPDLEFIGMRTGEKLHESLISGDETAEVYDLGDRYVCLPNFQTFSGPDPYHKLRSDRKLKKRPYGKPYDSLTNETYLEGENLREALFAGARDFGLTIAQRGGAG